MSTAGARPAPRRATDDNARENTEPGKRKEALIVARPISAVKTQSGTRRTPPSPARMSKRTVCAMTTRRLFEVAAMVAKMSAEMMPVRTGPVSARKNALKPVSGSAKFGMTPRRAIPKRVMAIQVNWTKPM